MDADFSHNPDDLLRLHDACALDLNHIRFVGYAFQIEMKWLAYQLGFRIKEVPIIFTDRTRGTSKMSKGIVEEAFFGVLQMKVSSWFSPLKRAA